MKVLHIIRKIDHGGGCLGLLRQCKLCNGLVKKDVYPLLINEEEDSNIVNEFQKQNVEIINFLNKEKLKEYDIIQIEWWNTPEINNFIVKTDFFDCKVVLYVRVNCNAPLMCPSINLLKKVDSCIQNSKISQNTLLKNNMKKAGIKYPLKVILSDADETNHNFSKKNNYIITLGYVGTIDPIKIYPNFLDMIKKIINKEPTVKFRFAGDGLLNQYKNSLKELKIEDSVEFEGHIGNRYDFLSQIDIFFYPLNQYSFAASEKALQEAMYAKLPIVTFKFDGLKNFFNKNNYQICESEVELINKTLELINNKKLRNFIGRRNFKIISENKLKKNVVSDLINYYDDIIDLSSKYKSSFKISPDELLDFCIDTSNLDEVKKNQDSHYLIKFIEDKYEDYINRI